MPEDKKSYFSWNCIQCSKKFYFIEPISVGNEWGITYCYNCYEDMLDEAEERRIQRIQQEQEY